MILVVGATGQLGGLVARRLLGDRLRDGPQPDGQQHSGHQPVRVLVRRDSSHEALAAAGAEAVIGDLKDRGSLDAACAGVDTVVTTANAVSRGGEDTIESVDREGNRNLIDAAVAAGVRRFVFTSALGADPDSPVPFLQAKAETEQRVRDSGMDWTVLSPNIFMDVWVPAVVGGPALTDQPVTLVGEGRRRHSFVSEQDVAAYAVAALNHSGSSHSTLVIGGPNPVSWRDVVETFEQELGRKLPVETVSPGTPVPGLPDMMSQLLAAQDTYDSPIDMTELAQTYGVTPTSMSDFVREFVAGNREPAAN